MTGIQFSAGTENFSLYHCIQTGSGAHPISYPVGTSGSCSGGGVKQLGHEADHSHLSGTEVKNARFYSSTPPIHLHGSVLSKAQVQLYY